MSLHESILVVLDAAASPLEVMVNENGGYDGSAST